MSRYRPPTIEEQGGLEVYLNRKDQLEKHRGLGYRMWTLSRHTARLNKTAMMKLFKISGETYDRYAEVDDKERKARRRAKLPQASDHDIK
jgi:hypothetical protein